MQLRESLPAVCPESAEVESAAERRDGLPAFRIVDRDTGGILDEIVAQVRAALESGVYAPGDPLPGERDLAAQFGVSRNTLREALNTLHIMGVLEIRHGARTRIAADGAAALERAFEFLLLLDRPGYVAIHQARESLEVQLAGEAAMRANSDDLAAIHAALLDHIAACAAIPRDSQRISLGNYQFHQAVAHAAHNPVLERVLVHLHDARRAFFRALIPGGNNRPETNEIHERIYYAIRDRQVEEARRAMTMDMGIALRVLHKISARHGTEAAAEPTPDALSPRDLVIR